MARIFGEAYHEIRPLKRVRFRLRLATLIMGETALPIHRMKSGPLGGDQQIGAMLANGELGLIIFLRDPLTAQPHEPDVSALLRLCDVQKIPLATNASSAIIMLEALKSGTFPAKQSDL